MIVGLDLTWADAAEAARRQAERLESGAECDPQPDPFGDVDPSSNDVEFPYRQFDDVSEIMERLGMGYAGKHLPDEAFSESEMREEAWRWQRLPENGGSRCSSSGQMTDGW
jgi:hypothetical protein